VSELLSELGLLPLYAETFAEYGLESVSQLTCDGHEAMDVRLRELGVTRDHRDRLLSLAFSPRPCGSSGGAFSRDFLAAVRPAHAAAMGAENLGPLLYSLLRFIKPRHVVEVGAGYTSLWLLQALADNAAELGRCASAVHADGYMVGTPPNQAEWLLPPGRACLADGGQDADAESGGWAEGGSPLLHTIDTMSHEHTTAHRVLGIAEQLGLKRFLRSSSRGTRMCCRLQTAGRVRSTSGSMCYGLTLASGLAAVLRAFSRAGGRGYGRAGCC
jgi:hypothetical protein